MIKLTEDEHDAIAESFNIGIGAAAAALSEMVGQEVALSVPEINLLDRATAAEHIKSRADKLITGVREGFSGSFSGHALLLFPQERSLELVRLLLKEDVPLEFLTDMEQEALVEVGNIILNACLGNIATIMGEEIMNEIPVAVKGNMHEIILNNDVVSDHEYVMELRMEFRVENVDIQGHIAFIMDIQSVHNFREKLAAYFGFPATTNA